MAANIFCFSLIIAFAFGGKLSLGLLDDASNSDVNVIKVRLSEEKSKRLLIQYDVESLMLKMKDMTRTIAGELNFFLLSLR